MQEQGSGPPVPYMERTRTYYRALGYTNDYVWAHHANVPFVPLTKPVGVTRVALICTAGPGDRSHRDERNRRHVWSGLVASPPESFDTDVAWDRESTHTDDRETFLPIDAAQRLVAEGTLGALAPRFHTAPTDYSQQKTTERDGPEILRRLREDDIDAAILTAL
jgi:Glycine/sarcosine/betaine reductase selenoprotein B (GRDB)